MSGGLRPSRRRCDRLSPEAVDGTAQLDQLRAPQSTDRRGRIDMQRIVRLRNRLWADPQLLTNCRQCVTDRLVRAEVLTLGQRIDDSFGAANGEKTQVSL